MFNLRSPSIRKKLAGMSMLASSVALLLSCATFLAYDVFTFRSAMVQRLAIRAEIIGFNSISPLLFRDTEAARQNLRVLQADPHILSAGIYGADGKTFASYWRDDESQTLAAPPFPAASNDAHRFDSQRLVLFRPILFEGRPVGAVYLASDLEELNTRVKRYLVILLLVLSVSLVLAVVISTRLQRGIVQPIAHLADTAARVSREKDYSVRASPLGGGDEVGFLTETFNDMLSEIQRRDVELQQARSAVEQKVRERTAELEAANTELDAANKELEAFSYSVSHDLRAPLRHIDGFSRILEEECASQLNSSATRCLQRIREGTRQMGLLVDDLLNLSRIGRQEVRRQVTGLTSLVEEVRAELQEAAAQRGVKRKVEWRIAQLPFADCDPILMKQVFANLLSNAAKYSRTRAQAVIEVGSLRQGEETVVFVRDNGVGFSMKYADKLFGVFQRLHRQEDFEGTGVGLATVQRIIHKHGGRIWVEAELDKGACFYFTLGTADSDGFREAATPAAVART